MSSASQPLVAGERRDETAVVGILGCGTMGVGIALVAALAGHTVLVGDADPSAMKAASGRIERDAERVAERAALDDSAKRGYVEATTSRVHPIEDITEIATAADWLIEAIVEDIGAKQRLLCAVEPHTGDSAVLATNTSSLSVASVASKLHRPERVVGMHFFNPAPFMKLVEVVSTATTDPNIPPRAAELVKGWGKEPVLCIDSPGFIVNRVNRAFTLEALSLLDSGQAGVEDIDNAVRGAGFRMGPFELMDLIGIDVNLAVATSLFDSFARSGDPHADRFRPNRIQQRMVDEGSLGRKSGRGFYSYPRDLDDALRLQAAERASPALATRIIIAVILEAYRALEDGVAAPDGIDRAMRLGANHPSGPFEWTRQLGGPEGVVKLAHTYGPGSRFAVPQMLAVAVD